MNKTDELTSAKKIPLWKKPLSRLGRGLLIGAGFLFTGVGIVGVFVPLLPTTPFLLLAAACFMRSSEKFYQMLISSPVFGKFIQNYTDGKGVPVRIKIITLTLLWATIFVSMFLIDILAVRIILPIIAFVVSIHIILIKRRK
jgi:uncharacterized membrane protein YbaN (DUF454 family)